MSPRGVLRHEIESELDFILKAWFPRTIDTEYGGFLSDFDYRWRPRGPQHKMLEYQARQTTAAAKGASRFKELYDTALHGFRYLKEIMWDAQSGGWFRLLDRSGNPLEGGLKHGHGSSYAISACVCCYELTEEQACLELAKTAFGWLEEHAHDSVNGGYFVFYHRDGCPILSEGFHGTLRDAIGTPIGCKDANTTSDLLKAFSDLYRVWPDTLLKERLLELLHIVRDRLVVAPGLMHMYTHPDWTPLPDFVRYGQVIRSANHLLAAAKTLESAADLLTSSVAKSMVDMMVRVAWDKQNGEHHGVCPRQILVASGGWHADFLGDGESVSIRASSLCRFGGAALAVYQGLHKRPKIRRLVCCGARYKSRGAEAAKGQHLERLLA
jgi:mannobiose 2-epimerase